MTTATLFEVEPATKGRAKRGRGRPRTRPLPKYNPATPALPKMPKPERWTGTLDQFVCNYLVTFGRGSWRKMWAAAARVGLTVSVEMIGASCERLESRGIIEAEPLAWLGWWCRGVRKD